MTKITLDVDEPELRMVANRLRSQADADEAADSHPGRGLVSSIAFRTVAEQIETQLPPVRPIQPGTYGVVTANPGASPTRHTWVHGADGYWYRIGVEGEAMREVWGNLYNIQVIQR